MPNKNIVNPNFQYPSIPKTAYKFGSGTLLGTVINESGDWRNFIPPYEYQNVRGIESSACYVEAQQHAIATIQEKQYGEKDNNYSARFNALLSGGTPQGGDPLRAGDSFRHDGLIPDFLMPFSDTIQSWEDFHSFKDTSESNCRSHGKSFLEVWDLKYDIVFERDYTLERKYQNLKEALKYSPVPISVYGWVEQDGVYIKPVGVNDNHLVLCLYVDEQNRMTILDTYAPFIKVLAPNYNSDFAMRWSVRQRTPEERAQRNNLWQGIVNALKKIVELLTGEVKKNLHPPVQELTTREKVFVEALNWIGKDASPLNKAPQEKACVESVCTILQKAGVQVPLLLSTVEFKKWLDANFTQTTEYKPGNIIISVTGTGNGTVAGHTGIFSDNDRIMSNSSLTGLWGVNYTLDKWISRWRTGGGMSIYFYEPV